MRKQLCIPLEDTVSMDRERKKRARLQTSSYERSSPNYPGEQLWLDLLPVEVYRRMTKLFVQPDCDPDVCAISLAKSSPIQLSLVREVVRECHFSYMEPVSTDWDEILGIDVRDAGIPFRSSDVTPGERTRFVKIFQNPNLVRALIGNDTEWLKAIKSSKSLRKLEIESAGFFGADDVLISNIGEVLDTLDTLDLTELSIRCGIHGGKDKCIIGRLCKIGTWALGLYCRKVSKVAIECPVSEASKTWAIIAGFPALREVTLRLRLDYLNSSAIRLLQSLDSVHLDDSDRRDIGLIGQIGNRVESLRFGYTANSDNFLTADDTHQLVACKGLRELQAELCPKAEAPLLSFCDNLRCLSLTWRYEKGQCRNHAAPEGWIHKLICKARSLTDLFLYNLSLSRGEIEVVLSELGARLGKFGFSMTGQGESAPAFMEFLMHRLATYNVSLTTFWIGRTDHYEKQLKLDYDCLSPGDITRLSASINVLGSRTKIVLFNLEDVRKFLLGRLLG